MKNSARKLLAFVLAAVLVLALNTVAFAASEPTEYSGPYQITITTELKNPGTFDAYQVFKGRLAEDASKNLILSNIEWGEGVNGDEILTELKADAENKFGVAFAACEDAAAVARVLEEKAKGDDPQFAQDFADVVGRHLKSPSNETPAAAADGKAVVTVPSAGYYLVKSNAPADTEGYADTRYMLEVVGNVTAEEKADIPTVDKQVEEVDDSKNTNGEWGEVADHDIGDKVNFKFTGTLPSNYDKYEKYTYIFHDTQSAGLTFDPTTVEVKVGDTTLTEGQFKVVTEGLTDGCTFEIQIEDLKTVAPDATSATEVVVTYSSTLNANAEIGNPGNDNKVYLQYSSNPNAGGTGTGKTPVDTVIVFTYELDVNKVNPQKQPLTGAEFAVYKKVPAGTPGAFNLTKDGKKLDEAGEGAKAYGDADGNAYWYLASQTVTKNDAGTEFYAKGLDDGDYTLFETTTPPGYNTIDPVDFTVESELNNVEGSEALKNVEFTADDPNVTITSGTGTDEEGDPSGKIGVGSTQIINNSGAQLPSTGGIGTTIFYVVGAILAVGAGILLIAKKRMQNHE